MSKLTRRIFMKWAGVTATAAYGGEDSWRRKVAATSRLNPIAPPEASAAALPGWVEAGSEAAARELTPQEIHRLLGFATMTGEDPLKLWQRLQNTKGWRVGPLAPDAWSGCVFIADAV